jgi:glutamate-1-semialdehyde aminotransferase
MEAYPGAGFSSLQDIIRTDARALKGIPRPLVVGFQEELRARCVDILSYTGGVTSAAHTEEDINRTLEIFQEVIRTLMKNHILAGLK